MGEPQAKNSFPLSPTEQGCSTDYCFIFDAAVFPTFMHVLLSKLIKPTSDLLRLERLYLQYKNLKASSMMKEFPSAKTRRKKIQAICLTANVLKKGHKLLTP